MLVPSESAEHVHGEADGGDVRRDLPSGAGAGAGLALFPGRAGGPVFESDAERSQTIADLVGERPLLAVTERGAQVDQQLDERRQVGHKVAAGRPELFPPEIDQASQLGPRLRDRFVASPSRLRLFNRLRELIGLASKLAVGASVFLRRKRPFCPPTLCTSSSPAWVAVSVTVACKTGALIDIAALRSSSRLKELSAG